MAYRAQQKAPRPRSPQVDIRSKRAAYRYKIMSRYVPTQVRGNYAAGRNVYKMGSWRPYQTEAQRAQLHWKGQFANATIMRLGGEGAKQAKAYYEQYGVPYKPYTNQSSTVINGNPDFSKMSKEQLIQYANMKAEWIRSVTGYDPRKQQPNAITGKYGDTNWMKTYESFVNQNNQSSSGGATGNRGPF